MTSRLGSSAPARISTKKIRPPKESKPSVKKLKPVSQGNKPVADKIATLRDEGALIKSPSTATETSSSEDESSSEEESEYDEDEEMPVMDISEVSNKYFYIASQWTSSFIGIFLYRSIYVVTCASSCNCQ